MYKQLAISNEQLTIIRQGTNHISGTSHITSTTRTTYTTCTTYNVL